MKSNSSQLIVRFLLISLFLQSCGGSTNLPIQEQREQLLAIEGQVSTIRGNHGQEQESNTHCL
ncbi:hypothetical protein Aasi_0111 [Candidatus Amoebophilus asiaticus 5a2]|uniref:Lipoprotein n=1 Tax=Amoebophilus asiaticus (strain 5a2) TaxID=452471 RepID=B3EUE0_AMOA5|nr:hypothetical protein [Candidatus Amoebophilus asiaticus]ACE05559.1 hypothetical protein Aasi_0111 [Candidatus Amoebophilus asiaticus 5a2]